MIFVNSMRDLFHKDGPDDYVVSAAPSASINPRDVSCQEMPQRSLHQPHALGLSAELEGREAG